MDDLSGLVGWASTILGSLCIATGVVLAWKHKDQSVPTPTPAELGDHGAVTDTIAKTADLAKALKDLDKSGQLLTVGVLLIAIAAISAGLDNVAEAIASTAGG